ncbi:MAG: uracil-DNA glycosylase [Pseudomonadales bacterium]|nr:uracil-DNA glycosylase [Pseudomonadales bacterium]
MNEVMERVRLSASWKAVLGDEFNKPYMESLRHFLLQEKSARKIIYPKGKDIFSALDHIEFDQVKVVILGQDPYHGPGQAHGLCFSVPKDVPAPPSLKNIFKEMNQDVMTQNGADGCLTAWAKQGVLLLNSVLTVEKGQAASHQYKGWEEFTDVVIQHLNQKREGLVFLLWGSYAQKKGQFIDNKKHLVLKAPHPSPLSAHRGFFGSKHFSRTNKYLVQNGQAAIDWQLS